MTGHRSPHPAARGGDVKDMTQKIPCDFRRDLQATLRGRRCGSLDPRSGGPPDPSSLASPGGPPSECSTARTRGKDARMTIRFTPSPSRPHIDPLGCRDLWRSVLLTAVRDLCSGPAQWREREAAELWVGTCPRRAFREVCDLAGFDPIRVHRVLKALRALAPEDRNALFSLEAHL